MKVNLMRELDQDSIVDGPGIRTVVWFQGCSHNCQGCHNPESHSFNKVVELDINDVLIAMNELEYQDGITLSGGDPLFQPEAALDILKHAKTLELDTWVYSGFLYEDILKMGDVYIELLKYIDVLVDGKFDLDKRSFDVKFRGSSNQRLIDVNKSLEKSKVVLLEL